MFIPIPMDHFPLPYFVITPLTLFILLVLSPFDSATQIKLAWDPDTEPDVAGYRVYYGTASRTYGVPTDVGNATTCTLNGLTQGVTYYIAVTAYDTANYESGYSNEVSGKITQTVSTPNALSGPTSGITGTSYSYTTGGSSSSLGHPVQYQFDWKGDGTDLSAWGSATQARTWTAAGTYNVRARARCKTDTSIVSNWSGSLSVTVGASIVTVSCTLTTNPSGLQITVDGSTYTAPQSFSWVTGSSHTISVPSPQSGASGVRYVYASWSDGGAQSHTVTVPSTSTTYTTNSTAQYSLTTSVNPAGAGTVNPSGTTWYSSGRSVSVSAMANLGYAFNDWSGDLSGTTNPLSITMSGPMSMVADFSTVSPVNTPVGPDLTGSWTTPITQTCKKTWRSTRCSLIGTLTISNIGNGNASSSSVYFYLSNNDTYDRGDTRLKSTAVRDITTGTSVTVIFNYSLPLGQAATGKYVIAVTDKRNSVKETNETNNTIVSGPIR